MWIKLYIKIIKISIKINIKIIRSSMALEGVLGARVRASVVLAPCCLYALWWKQPERWGWMTTENGWLSTAVSLVEVLHENRKHRFPVQLPVPPRVTDSLNKRINEFGSITHHGNLRGVFFIVSIQWRLCCGIDYLFNHIKMCCICLYHVCLIM